MTKLVRALDTRIFHRLNEAIVFFGLIFFLEGLASNWQLCILRGMSNAHHATVSRTTTTFKSLYAGHSRGLTTALVLLSRWFTIRLPRSAKQAHPRNAGNHLDKRMGALTLEFSRKLLPGQPVQRLLLRGQRRTLERPDSAANTQLQSPITVALCLWLVYRS